MAALATVLDVVAVLGRDVTDQEIDKIEVQLDAASASVRAYTGQQFETGEATIRLQVRAGKITLPQRPVLTVESVDDMNGYPLSFTWWAGDKVEVPWNVPDSWSFEPWHTGIQYVDVTYTYGFTTIPADIVGVVVQKAIRGLSTPAEQSGYTTATLGDASISYGTVGAAGAAGFFDAERSVLDLYRRVLGQMRVD